MKKEKKAEVSMSWLVIVILTILGFVILLLLYLFFPWKEDITKETCHQSIIFRATMPFGAYYVPLKCQTEKTCITASSSGECEQLGKKDVRRKKVKDKEEIAEIIANEMVDCWRVTGEGKLGIFPKDFLASIGFGNMRSSCLICSRIAISNDVGKKLDIKTEEIDLNKYLKEKNIAGVDMTYYDYFSNMGKAEIRIDNLVLTSKSKETGKEEEIMIGEIEKPPEDISKDESSKNIAVLFMQIPSIGHGEAFKNLVLGAAVVTGGSFFIKPLKWIEKKAIGVIGWKVAAAIGLIVVGAQQINVAWNRAAVAGYCGDVKSGGEAKEGCSVVRVINYEPNDINQYCDTIESIP